MSPVSSAWSISMSLTDAYAAGLLDGEGCVYIQRNKGRSKKERNFTINVRVGMTAKAKPLLDRLKEKYGGRICLSQPATERWAEQVTWSLYGEEAAKFLTAVSPHLILKQAQASLAMSFWSLWQSLKDKGGKIAKWTEEASATAEAIRQQ